MSITRLCSRVALWTTCVLAPLAAQDSYSPPLEPASDEWQAALAAMTVPAGLKLQLFAAEPRLAHPVCLYVDHGGAVYVGETFRHHAGVTDIREHWDWLDADLAARTVEDRLGYMAELTGDEYDSYAGEHDRIKLLRDTDGDGLADTDTVFADGFSDHATGIGAGLLVRDGQVYYACIPELWRLSDDDGDDVADRRAPLSSGYGVHTGLLGHDLHGLRVGPDRRLYFSMGDRGLHVVTPRGELAHPHTGAVLRCELDGSDLQLVHTGLRNPQELVFDRFGDLFTGDNNSDGGDEARWVAIVPGGDSGWRFSYQWIESPVSRGPWNDEQLWKPAFARQAAWHLPPIANIANGPSGLTLDPGTGLPDRWREHFFLCDFLGGARWSGIHAFKLEQQGAGYRMTGRTRLLWNVLVTDADFGPDGSLYLTDWVEGWNRTGKGRIWKLSAAQPDSVSAQTAELLGAGFTQRSVDELAALLSHPDQRVRSEAHFALADAGADGIDALTEAAQDGDQVLQRLHGIWGLWIAGRRERDVLEPLLGLTRDAEDEVRAQSFRVLGDLAWKPARTVVVAGLSDPAPRARAQAAHAAGRLGIPEALDGLFTMLDDAGDDDALLRHAAVSGLIGCADDATLLARAKGASHAQRMGVALALRRLESPLLGGYLGTLEHSTDPEDVWVALEVVRAIHDVPVRSAAPALAALLDPQSPLLPAVLADDALPDAVIVRRALAANRALGKTHHARRVASLAANPAVPAELAAEAIDVLTAWATPSSRDLVMGDWRPLPERPAPFLPELAAELAQAGMDQAPESVQLAFLRLLDASGAEAHAERLGAWLADEQLPSTVRAGSLTRLHTLAVPHFDALLGEALADADGRLRAAALPLLLERSPADAARFLPTLLAVGELAERRAAYDILSSPELDPALVARHLDHELTLLEAGLVSPELQLDLALAAEASGRGPALVARHARATELDPVLAPWLDTLFGGDGQAGRVQFERTELSCQRCHAVDADSGHRVGPALDGISERRTRLELLAAIVDPNRSLSPGYQSTNVFLADGSVLTGRLIDETGQELVLLDSEGLLHTLDLRGVNERRDGLSAMPEELAAGLDRNQLRDLIEYLATL